MDALEIEQWAKDGRKTAVTELNLDPGWWPTTTRSGQREASAWSLAMFLHAALARCVGSELTAACSAGSAKPLNRKIVDALWSQVASRKHQPAQVILDFSVHNLRASSPIQFTGESEMFAQHSTDKDGDYAWDFYKLMLVPSASRLFVARVGGARSESSGSRCTKLADTLSEMVDRYGPVMLRPHDELGAVIIPSSKKERNEMLLCWLDRGRLRRGRIKTPFF
jgi:hypothetical protein